LSDFEKEPNRAPENNPEGSSGFPPIWAVTHRQLLPKASPQPVCGAARACSFGLLLCRSRQAISEGGGGPAGGSVGIEMNVPSRLRLMGYQLQGRGPFKTGQHSLIGTSRIRGEPGTAAKQFATRPGIILFFWARRP